VREAAPHSGWDLSERHPESNACRESGGDGRCRAPFGRGSRACLGWRLCPRFFFDAEGRFIDGYYLVGLLAEAFLAREPGARIVHDPRVTWNTLDIVRRHGGTPVLCKSGHAFIKQKMREVDAAYGGEMSAHHYFRRFAYCDSGMIPWLLVLAVET